MKKSFVLEDLCCANCAARIERAIQKLEGVESAAVNFMTQKLTLEADDDKFEALLDEAEKICRKIEPDCTLRR